MTIRPIHQNPPDLVLAVLPDHMQLDLSLTILRHEVLRVGGWAFTFHIIGESHLVRVTYDDQPVLCELLACIRVQDDVCSHHHAFTDLCGHGYTSLGYSVEVSFDGQLREQFGKQGIEVEFPKMDGQTPVTRIEWQHDAESGRVRWQTLHLYPQKQGVIGVRSISHFNLSNYNQSP